MLSCSCPQSLLVKSRGRGVRVIPGTNCAFLGWDRTWKISVLTLGLSALETLDDKSLWVSTGAELLPTLQLLISAGDQRGRGTAGRHWGLQSPSSPSRPTWENSGSFVGVLGVLQERVWSRGGRICLCCQRRNKSLHVAKIAGRSCQSAV